MIFESPRPTTMCLSSLMFMSTVFFHTILEGSMFRGLSLTRLFSSTAESRLWAAATAWMSPVNSRSIFHMG